MFEMESQRRPEEARGDAAIETMEGSSRSELRKPTALPASEYFQTPAWDWKQAES